MNIPEYNQRLVSSPVKRTLNNVVEPKEFSDVSGQMRRANAMSKELGVAGDVFLDMKKQRDMGIVNQFLVEFDSASEAKIAELQSKYKGADSQSIVEAYQLWQEDYTAKHIGPNQDEDSKELFLENNEQIVEARKQLAGDLHIKINSLSSYASSQLNKYNEHYFDARIFNEAEKIAKENNLDNISLHSDNIAYLVGQQNPNAPTEYNQMVAKKILDKAYSSSLTRMMESNPQQAALAIQTPLFQKNMLADTVNKDTESIISSLIARQGNEVAEMWVQGKEGTLAMSPEMYEGIKPILSKYGEERFKAEVLKDAEGKRASFEKSINDTRNTKLNYDVANLFSLMNSFESAKDPTDKEDIQNDLTQFVGALRQDADGAYLVKEVGEITSGIAQYKEKKDAYDSTLGRTPNCRNKEECDAYFKKVEDFENEQAIIQGQAGRVAEALDRIRRGDFKNYTDVIDEDFHAVNKNVLFQEIASEQKYQQARNILKKKKGVDIENLIKPNFKVFFGGDEKSNSPMYGEYRKAMKDKILLYYQEHKEFPEGDSLNGLARSAYLDMFNGNNKVSAIYEVASQLGKIEKDLKRDYGYVVPEDYLAKIQDNLNNSVFGVLSDTEKKEVAKYFANGNLTAISLMLGAYYQ